MAAFVLAASMTLFALAFVASRKDWRVVSGCAAFCAVCLAVAFAGERGAAAAARRASSAADRTIAAAVASWSSRKAPESERVLTFFVEDALDGDAPEGTPPGLAAGLTALLDKFTGSGAAAPRLGLRPPGVAVDWRTQSLSWAAERDSQYDAISRAVIAARNAGARVQVVARGRGAAAVLGGLRRNGAARPDRILIVGLAPEPGDERLAADAAFVFSGTGGAQLLYTGADGAWVRRRGRDLTSLLAEAGRAVDAQTPFRGAPPAAFAPLRVLGGSIGGVIGSGPLR